MRSTAVDLVLFLLCSLVACYYSQRVEAYALRRIQETAPSSCATELWLTIKGQLVNSTSQDDWGPILDDVLQSPACRSVTTNATVVISWLRYPAWFNGLSWRWISDMRDDPATAAVLAGAVFDQPDGLPPLGSFTSGASMRDYTVLLEGAYTITSDDPSGVTQSTVWSYLKTTGTTTENVCVNNTDPRGLLHPRSYLLMYYREDTLTQLQGMGYTASSSPPSDWEGLLELLRVHKFAVDAISTSLGSNATGAATLPTYGICITTHPDCGRLGDVFAAVASSIVQTQGTSQGVYWDLTYPPPSAVPMMNTTGWQYAADIVRRLLQFNAPDTLGSDTDSDADRECTDVSQSFTGGDCMITLEWDAVFSSLQNAMQRPGVGVGVAPLPGSHLVMDRRSESSTFGRLVGCTWDLCAASANHDLLYLGSANGISSSNGTGAVSAAFAMDRIAPEALVTVDGQPTRDCDVRAVIQLEAAAVSQVFGSQTQPQRPVNRAPYSVILQAIARYSNQSIPGGGPNANTVLRTVTDALDKRVTEQYYLKRDVANAARQWLGYTVPNDSYGDPVAYIRMRWWIALAQPFDVSAYTAKNISESSAQAYMRAVWHALHSPNSAIDVPSPNYVNFAKWGLGHAALLLEPSEPQALANGTQAVINATETLNKVFRMMNDAFGSALIRDVYVLAINNIWSPSAPTKQGSKGISSGSLAALLVCLLVAVVLLLLTLLLLGLRNRRRHRDLLGRVLAPRAGPDTTLLVSDVQNSTRLWEELSVSTMDSALKTHHATFRRVMALHDGYESATEGDSFLIAFSNPASAVAFAAACQLALLHEDWPAELLSHPDGALVAVDPRDTAAQLVGAAARPQRAARVTAPRFCLRAYLWGLALRMLGKPASARVPTPVSAASSGKSLAATDSNSEQPGRNTTEDGPNFMKDSHDNNNNYPSNRETATLALAVDTASHADGTSTQAQDSLPWAPSLEDRNSPASTISTGTGMPTAGMWWPGASSTWRKALTAAFPMEAPAITAASLPVARPCKISNYLSGDKRVVAYRGLCVRMGIHSGLDDQHYMVFNKVGSSFKYYGPFAETAKLVSDTAPGGLVTLSGRAFARLRHGEAAAGRGCTSSSTVVIYAGHHILVDERAPLASLAPSPAPSLAPPVTSGAPSPFTAAIVAALAAPPATVTASSSTIAAAVGPNEVRLEMTGLGKQAAAAGSPPSKKAPQTLAPQTPSAGQPGCGFVAGVAPGEEVPLFVALPTALLCRLAHSAPLRTVRETQLGSLSAPTGTVAIAFMKVVGASTLLVDLPGPASRALEQFQRLACGLLGAAGGYLVEGGDGLLLAAFREPLAGVEWALDCVDALKQLEWEEELLSHELCEEVVTAGIAAPVPSAAPPAPAAAAQHIPAGRMPHSLSPLGLSSSPKGSFSFFSALHDAGSRAHGHWNRESSSPTGLRLSNGKGQGGTSKSLLPHSTSGEMAAAGGAGAAAPQGAGAGLGKVSNLRIVAASKRSHERGLRVKVGLDVGPVAYSLTESSGRLSYRGRVMNRAARIAGKAAAGQVLCSGAVWQACETGMALGCNSSSARSDDEAARGIVGVSLGKLALKGISAPVEVVQCTRGT